MNIIVFFQDVYPRYGIPARRNQVQSVRLLDKLLYYPSGQGVIIDDHAVHGHLY